MGIPRIEPYALPGSADLPLARVDWEIDVGRAALLVHDMQRHFVGAFTEASDPIAGAVRNIAALSRYCRRAGVPIFYTAQPGDQDPLDRGLQADFWGPGMSSRDQAIVDELTPEPEDFVLTKWRYSAFQRTPLEEMLRARGRSHLLITGVYAHIGCLLTAADAFMRDVKPFIVGDAVADFSRASHDQALAYAAGRFARVVTTEQVIAPK